jgi:LysM repeat protein
MRKWLLSLTLFSYAIALDARSPSDFDTKLELDEMHIELGDLKQALKTVQVDLSLLDERLQKQNKNREQTQGKEIGSLSVLTSQVSLLEKKVSKLEKTLEKTANDLQTLSSSSTETLNKVHEMEQRLLSHEKRLDEVIKLKNTLTSISKAMKERSYETPASAKTYHVKAGDTLEKIARIHSVSVEEIQKLNNLKNDKIVVGQELRLPDDPM